MQAMGSVGQVMQVAVAYAVWKKVVMPLTGVGARFN